MRSGKWALVGRNLLDDESSLTFDYPFFNPSDDVPLGSSTIGSLNRSRNIAIQGRYSF